MAAQPGTPMLSWSDAAFSQEINLKVLILPRKYQQGCGGAALAGSEGSMHSKRHHWLVGQNWDHPASPLLYFSLILRTEKPDFFPYFLSSTSPLKPKRRPVQTGHLRVQCSEGQR